MLPADSLACAAAPLLETISAAAVDAAQLSKTVFAAAAGGGKKQNKYAALERESMKQVVLFASLGCWIKFLVVVE